MNAKELANISDQSINAIKELESKIAMQEEKVILIAYKDDK